MANTIDNPFVITGYESPEYFCDRKNELSRLTEALENGRNVILTSARRMGKTGLILHLFHQLKKKQKNVTTIYMDLFSTQNLNEFTKMFASSVLGQLDSDVTRIFKKFSSAIKGLRPILSIDELTGMPKVGVDIVSGQEGSTIAEVFKYLKQSERKCYIAFDEFQQVALYPEKNVEALLRSYIQNIHNVRFIFSGSRVHLLNEMFLSAKRPFYQSASSLAIGVIDEDEYWKFADSFFRKQGRNISREIFHSVYEQYEGHTWYIQKILNQIYGKGDRVIDETLVKEAIIDIIRENEYYYQSLLGRYKNGQVKLLKAVALEGIVTEITAGAFISRYELKAASSVKSALQRLLDDEILYKTDHGYIVYDRFFGQWIASIYR